MRISGALRLLKQAARVVHFWGGRAVRGKASVISHAGSTCRYISHQVNTHECWRLIVDMDVVVMTDEYTVLHLDCP